MEISEIAKLETLFPGIRAGVSDREIATAEERREAVLETYGNGGKSRLARAGFPLRHREKLKSGELETDGEWAKSLAVVIRGIARGGLAAILGPRGTGKTQMATCAAREFLRGGDRRTAIYVKARRLFLAYKDAFSPKSEFLESDIQNRFCRAGLLVVDEAHERSGSRWEDGILTSIVDERYDSGRPTVLISNLERGSFVAEIGPSIASRLEEVGGVVEAKWGSFRKR